MKKIMKLLVLFLLVFVISCNDEKEDVTVDELNKIFNEIDKDSITEDLTLPVKIKDIDIVWNSNKPLVISNEGKVTRSDKDEVVRIRASWTFFEEQKDVEYVFIVLADVINENDVLEIKEVKNNLLKDVNLTNVKADLDLPTTVGRVNIIWKSSNETALSNTGKVTREYNNVLVTLVATLSIGSLKEVVSFNVVLLSKEVDTLSEEMANIKASLLKDVDLSNVTENLVLPKTINFSSIIWQSSDELVISTEGIVNRQIEDNKIVLTATINVAYITEKVEFSIVVIGTHLDKAVKEAINNILVNVDLNNYLSDSIDLPKEYKEVKIEWTSSNENVITNDGVVYHLDKDIAVTLRALFYDGNYIEEKEYIVIVKGVKIDEDLKNALLNTINYELLYKVSYTGGGWETTYQYTESQMKMIYEYEGEISSYYLATIDDVLYLIYEYDGQVYKFSENDDEFEDEYYYASFDAIYLEDIDYTDYVLKDGFYVPKEGKLQKVAKDALGDFDYDDEYGKASEVFESFKIKVENGFIVSLFAESLYEGVENGEAFSADYTYELTFSKYNEITIELPNLDTPSGGIKDAYDKEGQTVIVGGAVTGVVGNNFFISDGEAGIYIYLGNNTEYADLIYTGSNVSVTGTVTYYNGLCEITSPTITASSTTYTSVVQELTELSNISDYLYSEVNVAKLTVKTITQLESGKDIKIILTDDVTDVNLFVSRYVSNYSDVYEELSQVKVGDSIKLNNVIVGYYKTAQLEYMSSSSFKLGDQPFVSELVLSEYRKIIYIGQDVNEELSDLKVYVTTSETEKTEILKEQYTITGEVDNQKAGIYNLVIKYEDFLETLVVVVKEESDTEYLTLDGVAVDKNVTIGLPSIGDVKILVFPVEFTDKKAPTNAVDNINKAFFGTEEQTGWESLSTYYNKSSYGKLNISGTVLDIYNTGKKSTYYENQYKTNENIDYEIIKAVLAYYDNQIDYSEYDANNDGYIDCIYIVYMADVSYDSGSDLWWAYTNEYFTDGYEYYDGLEPDFYIFSGYDFIEEAAIYGEQKDEYIDINSATFIHETGHALGLDDYYDYEEAKGPKGGIGGSDMMDSTIGDHNAFSKAILGWITPEVINTTQTITLNSFSLTGDAIIIAKKWEDSLFTEYYIIDFYTPDGLNELHKGYSGLFNVDGIRIYHIDATLNTSTVSPSTDIFSVYTYNNTDTKHKLISLIEADGKNDIEKNEYSSDSDLFKAGSSFTNAKWYDGTSANFTIKVDSITNNNGVKEATISIVYN